MRASAVRHGPSVALDQEHGLVETELSASPAERLKLAFELFDAGEQLMRMSLRRRFPLADDSEIEGRLCEWLQSSPIG